MVWTARRYHLQRVGLHFGAGAADSGRSVLGPGLVLCSVLTDSLGVLWRSQIGQAFQNKTMLAMTELKIKKSGHKAVKGCVRPPAKFSCIQTVRACPRELAHMSRFCPPPLEYNTPPIEFMPCRPISCPGLHPSVRRDGLVGSQLQWLRNTPLQADSF